GGLQGGGAGAAGAKGRWGAARYEAPPAPRDICRAPHLGSPDAVNREREARYRDAGRWTARDRSSESPPPIRALRAKPDAVRERGDADPIQFRRRATTSRRCAAEPCTAADRPAFAASTDRSPTATAAAPHRRADRARCACAPFPAHRSTGRPAGRCARSSAAAPSRAGAALLRRGVVSLADQGTPPPA